MFDMTEALNKQTKSAVSKAWLTVKGALGMGASKDAEKVLCDSTAYQCMSGNNLSCCIFYMVVHKVTELARGQ